MELYGLITRHSDPWSIVSLAFFLRYPNPYASHVASCDVISRNFTPSGTLVTTRLILKRGSLPKWAPRGIISKSDCWILEESEVDPVNGTVTCTTKNLDHVKVMRVEEQVTFQRTDDKYAARKRLLCARLLTHARTAKRCNGQKHASYPISAGG